MNKNLLTFDILTRFENEYITDDYTEEQRRTVESDAKVAMYNRLYHYEHNEEWTDNDIYNDFLRILKIDKISLIRK